MTDRFRNFRDPYPAPPAQSELGARVPAHHGHSTDDLQWETQVRVDGVAAGFWKLLETRYLTVYPDVPGSGEGGEIALAADIDAGDTVYFWMDTMGDVFRILYGTYPDFADVAVAFQINADGTFTFPSGLTGVATIKDTNGVTRIAVVADGAMTLFDEDGATARVIVQDGADVDIVNGPLDLSGNILKGVGLLNLTQQDATIASGAFTITASYVALTPETGPSDVLTTISGGTTGDVAVLRTTSGNTITAEDATGNLQLAGGADFVLDAPADRLTLHFSGSNWVEVSRSDNS